MGKIFGVQEISSHQSPDTVQTIDIRLVAEDYDFRQLYNAKFDDLFPDKAIHKCGHCGQYGARKCPCRFCGAPID